MPSYLDEKTGVLQKAVEPPSTASVEVRGHGTLLRTRRPDGTWTAERVHYLKVPDRIAQGWEHVLWKRSPVPEAWVTGERSEIRFGFARMTRNEKRAVGENPGTAVVLPEEPGLQSAAECPGSRYMFQVGMLTGGAPADYLIEKLLSFRVRKLGLNTEAGLSVIRGEQGFQPRGFIGPSPWQKERLEGLVTLATALSDDLAFAARETFGTDQKYTAWSRRRQWKAMKELPR